VKLSASLKMYGSFRVNIVSIVMVIANPKMSFTVKQGWNGILSVFLFNPNGLFDPVSWRNNRWINTIAAITNGIRKCSAKNPVSVGGIVYHKSSSYSMNNFLSYVLFCCVSVDSISYADFI